MGNVATASFALDYLMLWCFGRLALTGQSPYDQVQLRNMIGALGFEVYDPGIGNYPWTLWLFSLFATLPYDYARVGWLITCLIVCLVCVKLADSLAAEVDSKERLSLIKLAIAALSFAPLINNFRWGQSNHVLCLGILAGLALLGRGRERCAGAVFSLIFFKAHLFLPLLAFFAGQFVSGKGRPFLRWLLIAFLVQCLVSFLMFPRAFAAFTQEILRNRLIASLYLMPAIGPLLSS